jgi:hypothetical protein
MGMVTEFVCAVTETPNQQVNIDQSKLSKQTWSWLHQYTWFPCPESKTEESNDLVIAENNNDEDEKTREEQIQYPHETIPLKDFAMLLNKGKIYSYMTKEMHKAFENISDAVDHAATLCFLYEEGFVFTISLKSSKSDNEEEQKSCVRYTLCENKKWIKEIKKKAKKATMSKASSAKENIVDTEYHGKIDASKFQQLLPKILLESHEIKISKQMESCPIQ